MNEQAKGWTPGMAGPWHWEKARTLMHLHNDAGNVACVSMPATPHPDYTAVANLIAAAPLMFAALEFAQKYAAMRAEKGEPLPAQLTGSIDAALSAARGEQ